MNAEVDQFFASLKSGKEELGLLRKLLLESHLKEEFKWKQPCYTYKGKNVIIVASLKDHVMISFFKGALLTDKEGLLDKPGDHTQSARIIRFYTLDEVKKTSQQIKTFIKEAIKIEETGKQVEKDESFFIEKPSELVGHFNKDKKFDKAFHQLTPGRQRAYLIFFSAAKQSETRISRIEKYKDRILKGFGFNDCICGLSKRMPSCDGSHKSY
ncbi:MAG: hypothetical protein RLZZ595_1978 [Bacteroidota bacterium]|jgi:uncharacterized protein YdeI (YjbR/CyaY-like superfamily)